jgi:hypothetical protein
MNKEVETAYNDAKTAHQRWGAQKDKYIENLKELSEAESNYESVVAEVTRALDSKDNVSKTAQLSLVKGHHRVILAKEKVNTCKRRKEAIAETIDWLKALHHLEKKRMECEADEVKYLGDK